MDLGGHNSVHNKRGNSGYLRSVLFIRSGGSSDLAILDVSSGKRLGRRWRRGALPRTLG